jgi:hypothetical protein
LDEPAGLFEPGLQSVSLSFGCQQDIGVHGPQMQCFHN